jgi:RNA polymerase subunit RPABC4/transcription elongation factor Spt4
MYGTLLGLVLVLVVLGSSGLVGLAVPRPAPPAASAPAYSPAPAATPADVTHGDLVVTAGETFTIQPTLGGRTYFQGGNITVLAGGTLIIENVTLSFVQFVSNAGSAQARLSHVMHFLDEGTVRAYNSTITTDVNVLNAYPKLNVTVTGTLTTWGSTLAFPGWVTVEGIGAVVTLNGTTVTNNPLIPSLSEPSNILGDSEYAPSLTALNGAEINLFNSTVNATYANNLLSNGLPLIAPLFANDVAGLVNLTDLGGSTTSANLTVDWLNPQFIPAGNVSVWFNTSTGGNGSGIVPTTVWYEGVGYPLGDINVPANTADGYASVPFSPALLAAINAGGLLNYLNNTGLFGGVDQISVEFGGTGAEFSTIRAALIPNLQYNLIGSGAGTTINTVDSVIDLTWDATPVTPWSVVSPVPWLSNKIVLTGGATGYFANLSVPNPITGVFSTSAVLPDDASTAYFFRWADLNLTGQGGVVPIYGATEDAYYAYGSSQANNATANSLNDLPASNPAIWGYVQYRDAQLGHPGYGISGRSGVSSLLLASTQLTGATTPDGNFLGTYHIGLLLPIAHNSARWFNWSVSPYPVGVAEGSPGYLGPDYGPDQHFPQYFAGAIFQADPAVTANGSAAPHGVRIGQLIGFDTTINSTGPAPITSLVAALLWGNASSRKVLATYETTSIDLNAVGETFPFTLSWLVNDSVTELNGSQSRAFTVVFTWNPGNVTGLSGTAVDTENVTILPSQIAFASFSLPPNPLSLSGSYYSTGVLHYNGSQSATLELFATPTSGGAPILIAAGSTLPGNFTLLWYPLDQGGNSQLSAGTSYTLLAVATYNHAEANYTLPGIYSIPGSTSPTSFLFQTFLGLPLWLWLAIAAGAAVAIIAVLFLLRRQAAGKVVECGECGNLIPEEATVCPKCGAEFESDLVRCSRCASTIPANSVVCPECAAQLLGVPGSAPEEAERQGYQDFTEKYRAEAKKELGENYNEGSFWDWWKRQPTYVSYSQWKLQQGQGAPRMGMSEPPAGGPGGPIASIPATVPPAAAPPPRASPPPPASTAPRAPPPAPVAAAPMAATPAAPAGGLKACPTCHKEIPGDYLVCPFCGSVTQ